MAKRRDKSPGTPASKQLGAANIEFCVLSYAHDQGVASYGLEAAEKLRLDPATVAKTLLAALPDGELVVAVVPVQYQLNLRALAVAAGAKKATMADPAAAERRTGYVRGGISPFGQRSKHRTFVDKGLELLPMVYVSGGRRGVDIGVAPSSFVEVLGATFADLAAT